MLCSLPSTLNGILVISVLKLLNIGSRHASFIAICAGVAGMEIIMNGQNQSFGSGGTGGGNGYIGVRRNGLTVILLSIVTCGIYLFYWYYQAMEDINRASGEQRMNSLTSFFCIDSIILFILRV